VEAVAAARDYQPTPVMKKRRTASIQKRENVL
jgi:hypothetical protein